MNAIHSELNTLTILCDACVDHKLEVSSELLKVGRSESLKNRLTF